LCPANPKAIALKKINKKSVTTTVFLLSGIIDYNGQLKEGDYNLTNSLVILIQRVTEKPATKKYLQWQGFTNCTSTATILLSLVLIARV